MPIDEQMIMGIQAATKDGLSPTAILSGISSKHPDLGAKIQSARQDKLNDNVILQGLAKKAYEFRQQRIISRTQAGIGTSGKGSSGVQQPGGVLEAIGQGAAMPYGLAAANPMTAQAHPVATNIGAAIGGIVPAAIGFTESLAAKVAPSLVKEVAPGLVARLGFSTLSGAAINAEQPFVEQKFGQGKSTYEALTSKEIKKSAFTGAAVGLGGAVVGEGLRYRSANIAKKAAAEQIAQQAAENKNIFMENLNSRITQPALPAPGTTTTVAREPGKVTMMGDAGTKIHPAPNIDSPIGKSILKTKQQLADAQALKAALGVNPTGEYTPNQPETKWQSDNPKVAGVTKQSYDTSAERLRGTQLKNSYESKLDKRISTLQDALEKQELKAHQDTVRRWQNKPTAPPPSDLRSINNVIVQRINNPGSDLSLDHEITGLTQSVQNGAAPQIAPKINAASDVSYQPSGIVSKFQATLQSMVNQFHTAVNPKTDVGGYTESALGRYMIGQRNMALSNIDNIARFGKILDKGTPQEKALFKEAVRYRWLGNKAGPVSNDAKAIASMVGQALDHLYGQAKAHGVEFEFMQNYLSQIVRSATKNDPLLARATSDFVKKAANASTSAEFHATFKNGFELQNWLDGTYGQGKFHVVQDLPAILATYQRGLLDAVGKRDLEYGLRNLVDKSTGLPAAMDAQTRNELLAQAQSEAYKAGGMDKLSPDRKGYFAKLHDYDDAIVYTAQGGERRVSVARGQAQRVWKPFIDQAGRKAGDVDKALNLLQTINRGYKTSVLNFNPFHAINVAKEFISAPTNPAWPAWANMLMDTAGIPLKLPYKAYKLYKAIDLLKDTDFMQNARLYGGLREFGLGNQMNEIMSRMDREMGIQDPAIWKGIKDAWGATHHITFDQFGRLVEAGMYADELKAVKRTSPGLSPGEIYQTAAANVETKLGAQHEEFMNAWIKHLGPTLAFSWRWTSSNASMPIGVLKRAGVPGMDATIEAMGAGLPNKPEAYQAFAKSQAALLTSALMSAYTLANMWTYHNIGKLTYQVVDPSDPQFFTKSFAIYRPDGTWFSFLQMYGDTTGFADGVKDAVTDLDFRQLGRWFSNKLGFFPRLGLMGFMAFEGKSVPGQYTIGEKAQRGLEGASKLGAPIPLQHIPEGARTGDYSKVGKDVLESLGYKGGTY